MNAKIVYTAPWQWWEIVSKNGEIETGDTWPSGYEEACAVAGTNLDDEESWCAQIKEVSPRHSALRVGDYVCCDGFGSDVVFVRVSQ